ncbi:MAG: lipoyl synthase, partial [Candidatus Sericytochromatia bacterium]
FEPKPEWLKIRPPAGENYKRIKGLLKEESLYTVCEEAHCPNVHECWAGGTATFMLMGDPCTRGCRFCAVKTGNPKGVLDHEEPYKISSSIGKLNLEYVVLTSVDRDDLPDGGSGHFAQTIVEIKKKDSKVIVEVLIPDFKGDWSALQKIIDAKPEVIAHNIETIERLTPTVRDKRAGYKQTLDLLDQVKKVDPSIFTKSSIMIGLGETEEEVFKTMEDLRSVDTDILTLGQYLRPTKKHLPVVEFVTPEKFAYYEKKGMEMGFKYIASGPLVRSSYKAGEYFIKNELIKK